MEYRLSRIDQPNNTGEICSNNSRSLKVLLIGFQDQDNLGLRYLMSSAQAQGHKVHIETFQDDVESLIHRVKEDCPDFIGLSLIFQYMTTRFSKVVDALRSEGVSAHISIGGHFPSFNYKRVLDAIPGADSIVRFEGEATLVELLSSIANDREWRNTEGIAYRCEEGSIRATKLRPQVMDLDSLPPPQRSDISYESSELPTASVLGSRGCPWNCDFCSIRPFYEAQDGKLRRLRSPKEVVKEMRSLYHDRGVATFLFQDDDFLATGLRARRWACEIASEILQSDIAGRIVYKISCRSDEVFEETISKLKSSGLTHVYMGVESGDEQGLKNMNKLIKPERHLQAAETLKKLGLSFDFGFMLLDPWSDFRMIRSNIDFLDRFVGDGWAVASFCRMLPYAGTPMVRKLEDEGRLGGSDEEPDYKFLDPKIDLFYSWMLQTFYTRNFTNEGLCHILRSLIFESRLQRSDSQWIQSEETLWLQHMAARTNLTATTVLRSALDHIEQTSIEKIDIRCGYLKALTVLEAKEEREITRKLSDFFVDSDRQRRRSLGKLRSSRGGFARSWTVADTDWETRGIGVR